MFQKVIYHKTYPKPAIDEFEASLDPSIEKFEAIMEDSLKESSDTSTPTPSSKDIFKMLHKGAVFVPLPEREAMAKKFIETVKDISESYEIDTEIKTGSGTITATFYFNCGAAMGFLKQAICLSDDIAFITNIGGYELVMSLDFYTHALFRHGKQFRP